jgi:hypothetical protein
MWVAKESRKDRAVLDFDARMMMMVVVVVVWDAKNNELEDMM